MQENMPKRRADDQLPHIQLLVGIKEEVSAAHTEILELRKDVSKAFPKDDDGLPDFVGHRKIHERDEKAIAKREEFQVGFVRDLAKWGAVSVVGFMIGLVVTYFKGIPPT